MWGRSKCRATATSVVTTHRSGTPELRLGDASALRQRHFRRYATSSTVLFNNKLMYLVGLYMCEESVAGMRGAACRGWRRCERDDEKVFRWLGRPPPRRWFVVAGDERATYTHPPTAQPDPRGKGGRLVVRPSAIAAPALYRYKLTYHSSIPLPTFQTGAVIASAPKVVGRGCGNGRRACTTHTLVHVRLTNHYSTLSTPQASA